MSRYKVFLLLILSILPQVLGAEERSVEAARDIAYDFMTSRVQTKSSVIDLRMVYNGESVATRSYGDAPAFYVFDNTAGPGFVIVSGDDSTIPVLGYSDSHNFKSEGMPSNLSWWLNMMRSQVNDLRSLNVPAHSRTASVGTEVVRYQTALWDQTEPYNNSCPLYGGKRSVTGCGPTAIAIAMRYREWPDAGVGTIPAYTTNSYNLRVSARKLGTAYNWQNMPLTDGATTSWTSTQKQEVARLMADIGAAAEADYSPDATAIYDDDAAYALSTYMKYDKSMYIAWRDYYSAGEWYPLIRKELDNGPVIYAGADDMGGHMFVLDGYTTEDYYHVNWGWGGLANGYYLLAALNPEEQGMGANQLGTYNEYQTALINMIPDKGGQYSDLIRYYPDRGYNGVVAKEQKFEAGVTYRIQSGCYCNFGYTDYNGYLRIVVLSSDNQVRQVLFEEEFELEYGYYSWYDSIYIKINEIHPGDHMVAQFYNNCTGEWETVRGNSDEGVIESVLLAEETGEDPGEDPGDEPGDEPGEEPEVESIEESTLMSYDHSSRTLIFMVKEGIRIECTDQEDNNIYVNDKGRGRYTVCLEGLPAGEYHVDLSRGKDHKRLVVKL